MRILKEAKQVGSLYHLTNIEGLENILENNAVTGYNYQGIYFTRNKLMTTYIGARPDTFFKLEVDGDKLSNRYKITPDQFVSLTGITFSEFAEFIGVNKIVNFKSYIKNYIFMLDNYLKFYKELFDNGEFIFGDTKKYYKKDLQEIMKGLRWSVQKGNSISFNETILKNLGLT